MHKDVIVIEITCHAKDRSPGKKFGGPIEAMEYSVSVNGDMEYQAKMTYKKWRSDSSPVREFERWLLDEQSKSRCDVCRNRSNGIDFFGNRGLQAFNLKQRLLNIFRRKLKIKKSTV
jgi:hypothetical protein